MEGWFAKAQPNVKNYQVGALNGNDCQKMLHHSDFLKGKKTVKKWYSNYLKNADNEIDF